MGLPPLPVLVRTFRPYLKIVVGMTWIWFRIVQPLLFWNSSVDTCFEMVDRKGHINDTGINCEVESKFFEIYNEKLSSLSGFWKYLDCNGKAATIIYKNADESYECFSYSAMGGLLDLLIHCYNGLASKILRYLSNHCTILTFHQIAAKIILFINDFFGILLFRALLTSVSSLYNFSLSEWKEECVQNIFEFSAQHIGVVKRELLKEEAKMEKFFIEKLKDSNKVITRALPKVGRDSDEISRYLEKQATRENSKWENGQVSGAVYCGDPSHTALLNSVYSFYSLSNPLHSDIWPTINQCEAEVVSMTSNLLNGGDTNVVGATTSGGTESIILAIRAHLKIYGQNRSIVKPEIICCVTAHAALDKASEMFGIRLLKIPCCPRAQSFSLDPIQVRRRLSSNTIMIYASAPCYPQGVIDPIEELSKVAVQYGVGLHVDACLGGFVLPFARMLGGLYSKLVPKFDFECEGVTSMSVDTHKYGYASKGTSVVLYRNKALRRSQYFNYAKWTGGLYCTPTIAGSRSGALLACAWASLVTIGESGFKSRVKLILDATQKIGEAVSLTPGLHLLGGRPQAMIVCFASDVVNIYQVGDAMTKLGWSLNSLQNPECLHLCVTMKVVEHADKFTKDLTAVVEEIHEKSRNISKVKSQGSAAIYGMAGSMPAGPVNELLKLYIDVSLTC